MKKLNQILTIAIVAVLAFSGFEASAQKRHTVMFYNVENLFDTLNDPDINDEEFLPTAAKAWNSAKYTRKLQNIEQVLMGVATANRDFPAVIGLSEIENRNVLEDIIVQGKLINGNYRICHHDSPDRRGVDVAFLYRPDRFEFEGQSALPVRMEEFPAMRTRDVVLMWGKIEGEQFCFMVAHWPSRSGGQAASDPKRRAAAKVMRDAADSIHRANPACKVVMMGDFNDDPFDPSIAEVLNAKQKTKELKEGDLFNPFWSMLKAGYGTLAYQDAWNSFDNIVVSENLVNARAGELRLQKGTQPKFYGNIYRASFLFQQSGQYKGYPLRTFVGNDFQGGYSDHLPVYIFIGK